MVETTKQVTLVAPDISCAHCVATVERAVGALDGVRQVTADAATKQVAVTFEPDRVALDQIADALAEVGYPPEA